MLEAAQDGTIFLEEIGELPMALQAKLLRALQEMKIRKVGANNEININCRLVTATHHDLVDLVEQGKFREDLYWRISTIIFKTLPLRLRQKDIIPLLKHFDTDHCIENYDYFANRINPATDLKGNVRTIQQLVRRYQLFEQLPGESL